MPEEVTHPGSQVWIALDVDKDRAVFRGYLLRDPNGAGGDPVEDAPTTEVLREILEWAFERSDDVLVRLDWAGSYWRVKKMTTDPSPADLEGELLIAIRSPADPVP